MPYQIKPVSGGFVVQDTKGKALSESAMKPLIGVGGIRRINPIAMPLNPRPLIRGKPASAYFVG